MNVLVKKLLYSEFVLCFDGWASPIYSTMETEKALKMVQKTDYAFSCSGKRHILKQKTTGSIDVVGVPVFIAITAHLHYGYYLQ